MKQNNFGELIFNESDVCDLLMSGRAPDSIKGMLIDDSVNIEQAINFVDRYPELIKYVDLYNNGALLLETVDYTVTSGSYTLAQTPTSNLNILVEQTFTRNGAV